MTKYYIDLHGTILETDNLSLWPEAKRLTAKEGKERVVAQAKAHLLELLKPGDTVHTVLRHVSSSGMSRRIDLYLLKDNRQAYLSGYVGQVLGYKLSDKGGLVVGGCGQDMGFHLVHSLGYALFGKEASEGKGKAANDLRRQLFKADKYYYLQGGAEKPNPNKPHSLWFGGAGYALKHKWL